jgi:hypothetical protein
MAVAPLLPDLSAPRRRLGSLMGRIKAAPRYPVCQEYGMTGRDFILSAISFVHQQQKRLLKSPYQHIEARKNSPKG